MRPNAARDGSQPGAVVASACVETGRTKESSHQLQSDFGTRGIESALHGELQCAFEFQVGHCTVCHNIPGAPMNGLAFTRVAQLLFILI